MKINLSNQKELLLKKIIITIIFFFLFNLSFAQQFTDIHAKLYKLMNSSVAWIDYDDDADLDIFVCGEDINNNIITMTYKNNKNDNFVFVNKKIQKICKGDVVCSDFDIDGDIDILLTGETDNNKIFSGIYSNINRKYFKYFKSGILPLKNSSMDVADFDRDGDDDIVICGEDNAGNFFSGVYRNQRNNKFINLNIPLIRITNGAVTWGDYDNDGDFDILLTGEGYNENIITKIYKNDTNTNFSDIHANIIGVKNSSVDWGDYDNDGDIDILLTGEVNENYCITKIYRNNGNDIFSDIHANLTGVKYGSCDWGDYDNDGDLDILITGKTENNIIISKVYRNDRNNTFVEINSGLTGVCYSSAQWGDYDNDGDIDILLSGLTDNCFLITKVYKNNLYNLQKKIIKQAYKPEKKVFNTKATVVKRILPKYYFVYSSCFCNPDPDYEKGLNLYISNVLYTVKDYDLQIRFNKQITSDKKIWSLINQGYRVLGYKTKKEALKARLDVIKEYSSQNFEVHYINL